MSGISVCAHIMRDADVTVALRESEHGKHAVLNTGDLALFIHSREKLLEVASLLEQAAQKWGGEA